MFLFIILTTFLPFLVWLSLQVTGYYKAAIREIYNTYLEIKSRMNHHHKTDFTFIANLNFMKELIYDGFAFEQCAPPVFLICLFIVY